MSQKEARSAAGLRKTQRDDAPGVSVEDGVEARSAIGVVDLHGAPVVGVLVPHQHGRQVRELRKTGILVPEVSDGSESTERHKIALRRLRGFFMRAAPHSCQKARAP